MNLISRVETGDGKIRVIANPEFTKNYLRDSFYVNYSSPNGDVVKIDENSALIPFIANVAPIIWLANLNVTVPELDEEYISALENIKQVFSEMYPSLSWDGRITAVKKTKKKKVSKGTSTAVLFSGGVDSVYSSLYCNSAEQTLMTVLGADIAGENKSGWSNVQNQAKSFADIYGHNNLYIETNFRKFLNISKLEKLWPDVGAWWSGVQHGIGFVGLTAPVTEGISRVVIAASHTTDFRESWASNPRLDSACRWGNVSVEHHGYESSRQIKINKIVDKTIEDNIKPQLRVCYSNPYGDGENCNKCEKCLRTFTGVLVAGADPYQYGLGDDRGSLIGIRRIRRRFLTYTMPIGPNERFMWTDIQKFAVKRLKKNKKHSSEKARFLVWFVNLDIGRYQKRSYTYLKMRKKIIKNIKSNPFIEKKTRQLVAVLNRV